VGKIACPIINGGTARRDFAHRWQVTGAGDSVHQRIISAWHHQAIAE
jgi:hypothetical protein